MKKPPTRPSANARGSATCCGGSLTGPRSGRLRLSEWVLVAFFAYVALLTRWFRDRPRLGYAPLVFLLVICSLLFLLARAEQKKQLSRTISITRDWLPIPLTLAAFREMGLFVPAHFQPHFENSWIHLDHLLLHDWHLGRAIETIGAVIPFFLESCYFFVYGLAAFCVTVLWFKTARKGIDRFFVIYLVGTLTAYALFPFFPSQPPRFLFPAADPPNFTNWVRHLNIYLLDRTSIHSGVFPSAHVSSAFSAAFAMFLLLPNQKSYGIGVLTYAICVSIATIYGRYHYAADVLAGFAVSLVAGGLCLVRRVWKADC